MSKKRIIVSITVLLLVTGITIAQKRDFTSVVTSANTNNVEAVIDAKSSTSWTLEAKYLEREQFLLLTLQTPGNLKALKLDMLGLSKQELQKTMDIFVTYDPKNLGKPLDYKVSGDKELTFSFPAKYGIYVQILFKERKNISEPIIIREIGIEYEKADKQETTAKGDRPWMNSQMPIEARVSSLLSIMKPEEKMELLREGWGIPGIPSLGIPSIIKVEALHGFSYGTGATMFPQSIGMGATWNKKLIEDVGNAIGEETASAHSFAAWSPVLDVVQDGRWGRTEETYGEDPVLVSYIGGAWIKGFQSNGLITTPKHFAGHGSPLGGRDSHDIGLSEREFREIALVPFRHVIQTLNCQSIMENYSDYLGVPVAKSKELMIGILREELGFDGFVVSDCGALRNLMDRKHYTAENVIEAANQGLSTGIATNCGDTYNDKNVIEAAKTGKLDKENLDFTCSTLLRTMFRNGLFENNPCKPMEWETQHPGWNSPEHKSIARKSACESIVLLENKNNILPLSKSIKSIAVIGPGADDLQLGDYSGKVIPGQLKSVLTGIKASVGKDTKVIYEKGCDFNTQKNSDISKAVMAAKEADVTILVLGDLSEDKNGEKATSGENHDYSSLILAGQQEELLKAVCATGRPVVLVLQAGHPYNLTYASEGCKAILVNWFPGQEGGLATADVLFGDYNPAGRLPITFPRNVSQLPLYYNFKTSGRGYEYSDMEYYPLYKFGYGLSYTTFSYSNLKIAMNNDGTVKIEANVTNTGKVKGDEVVQMYVTDMYASVKTRVMELKDFTRITLEPEETQKVSFILSPYELSLLNEKMDRVVEAGDFKICVGGKSPNYIASDEIKNSVGYENPSQGLSTMLNYTKSYSADFTLTMGDISTKASVIVKNIGNLTDAGKVTMYINGVQKEEVHHFELAPGEEKEVFFNLDVNEKIKEIIFSTKYKSVSKIL
jgi:beta-glucosidase